MALHFDKATRATLTSVNPQSENHGPDELVPALHLRFAVDAPLSLLAQFHPELALMLYNDATGKLRFPKLAQPLKWDAESINNELAIDYGIAGETNPESLLCRVHRHVLTCKDGGVLCEFTCTCTQELNEHVVGRLGMLVKHALFIKLTQGEPAPVKSDDDKQGTLSLVQ